jgi:hypothetical protein
LEQNEEQQGQFVLFTAFGHVAEMRFFLFKALIPKVGSPKSETWYLEYVLDGNKSSGGRAAAAGCCYTAMGSHIDCGQVTLLVTAYTHILQEVYR